MKQLTLCTLFACALALLAGCDKPAPTTPGVDLALGESVYTQRCAGCHERGLAGAPQTGKAEEWTPALNRGIDTLIINSINGYRGERGFMPPRGGHASLSDVEVTAAVHYLVNKVR